MSALSLRFGKYLGLIRLGVLIWLSYRVTSFLKILDFPVVIAVYYFLFSALYRALPADDQTLGGMDRSATLTYIALVWLVESLINTRLDRDMGSDVREGKIAVQLVRPIDFQAYQFWQTVGHVCYRLGVITLPVTLIGIGVFHLRPPASEGALGLFLVALTGAFCLMFLFNYVMGLMAFFLEWNYGLWVMKETLLRGLGGLLIPLMLFPEAIQRVLLASPFPGLYYTPVQTYLGTLAAPEQTRLLLLQVLWILVLVALSRVLTLLAFRKVHIMGG